MDTVHFISFPGIGIDSFKIDSVAFTLFGRDIYWYGVLIALGMVLAFLYCMTRANYERVKSDDMIDLALFTLITSIIGARAYYVIFTWGEQYIERLADGSLDFWKTLRNIVAVWDGGLAIYGALIAGFLTVWAVARVKRIRFPVLLDIVAPGLFIGQLIGRWGNFFNAEAYGTSANVGSWFLRMGISDNNAVFTYVHPTFLYESLWNLVGFIIIAVFYKKKRFNGQVFLFYMSWYGLGRAAIELLRTDSLMIGSLRVSHLVGTLTFAVGVVLMIYNLVRTRNYKRFDSLIAQGTPDGESEVSSTDVSDVTNETDTAENDLAEEIKTDAAEAETEAETEQGEGDEKQD